MSDQPLDRRRWWLILGAVALTGAVARAVYVMAVSRHLPLGADATWYLLQRGSIFERTGYVDPELLFRTGQAVPTANFPPLYPAFLVVVRMVAGDSETVAQLAGAVTGALTVVLTGLLARRLTGPSAALVAAAVVALCPALIAADGSLMSETLFVPLVVAAVLLTHLAGSGRTWAWPAVGAVCGLAALTRTEALLLFALLVLPALWWAQGSWRSRLLGAGMAVVGIAVVVTPWMARNADRVGSFTISTVSPDTALAGANCDATYGGDGLGSWDYGCTRPELRRELGEQAWGRRLRADTRDYIGEHLGTVPVVVVARELRVWGLWDPTDQVPREVVETRSEWFQWLAWGAGFVVLVGGVAGLVQLGAGRRDVVVLWAPVAMVALTAALTHGNTRFAAVAQPFLAVGVGALVCAARGCRGERAPREAGGAAGPPLLHDGSGAALRGGAG